MFQTIVTMNREIWLAFMYFLLFVGTKVQLLSARPRDTSTAGFVNWPLMSVATWGENPRGLWKVTVMDKVSNLFKD